MENAHRLCAGAEAKAFDAQIEKPYSLQVLALSVSGASCV